MAAHHHHDHDHEHDHPHAGLASAPAVPPDPAQESLVSALQASFNVLRLILVALVVAYFASGIFRVEPGEQGLIVRLGKLYSAPGESPVLQPGYHPSLPDPFDEKIRLSGGVNRLEINSFVFERNPEESTKPLSEATPLTGSLQPGKDGAMMTGDKNLSHGIWRVEYRIADGARFVKRVGESPQRFDPLLLRLAETAIVRTVASCRVEEVTRSNISAIAEKVRETLQASLDHLETGVEIVKVVSDSVEPVQVREAFKDVDSAQSQSQGEIESARKRATELMNQAAGPTHVELIAAIDAYGAAQTTGADEARMAELRGAIDRELDRAGGRVAMRLREAQSLANETREAAQREYQTFTYLAELYQRDPLLTRVRIWTQMRDDVLSSKQNELFFLPGIGDLQILTNRDMERLLQGEMDRLRRPGGAPR